MFVICENLLFQVLIIALLVVNTVYAGNLAYGGGLTLGGGLGYGNGLALGGGYGGIGSLAFGAGGKGYGGYGGPISAAVHSRRTYEVVPTPVIEEPAQLTTVYVEGTIQPVTITFRSVSSPVLVKQRHYPGEPGTYQATSSVDEPHRLVHEVVRPVIQEVREVIQPHRRVVQKIAPVLEEVHTVVAKGVGKSGYGYLGGRYGGGLALGAGYGGGYGLGLAKRGFAGLAY